MRLPKKYTWPRRSKKDVFSQSDCVVVLYESIINKKKQGHFVVLIVQGNLVEYFSSLGKSPTDELHEMQLNETPKFKQILGKRFKYNKIPLQNQQDYTVNDCGLFVIARCLLRKKPLREFIKLMRTTPRSSDDLIALMSILLVAFVET